jgi:hypothetical protein
LATRLRENPRFGLGAVIALAALVGLVVWLVTESGGGSSSKSTTAKPVALSGSGLNTFAARLRQPIYWIGSKPGDTYELTQSPNSFLLRYLPKGVKTGSATEYLSIGTYAMTDAFDRMKALAGKPQTVAIDLPGGGIGLVNKTRPRSVYVAYPGWSSQVEVYDPNPAVARRIAKGGFVRPVSSPAARARGPKAVSPAQLKSLAALLGHPIYWVGSRPNVTYELKVTPEGLVYVRYLPKGVAVGAERPVLTIATYPVTNAFAVTKSAANGQGVVTIHVPGGGIAAYSTQSPTNVHLAYPGEDAQVEVYDPSGKVPPKLVASGHVVPVS